MDLGVVPVRDYLTNICTVSSQDFPRAPREGNIYVLLETVTGRTFAVTARVVNDQLEAPVGKIGLSSAQRDWCQITEASRLKCQLFDPFDSEKPFIDTVHFEVKWASDKSEFRPDNTTVEESALENLTLQQLDKHILVPGQRLIIRNKDNLLLLLIVSSLKTREESSPVVNQAETVLSRTPGTRGIMTETTVVHYASQEIKLHKKALVMPKTPSFENSGIGGLDKEMETILRRTFASRRTISKEHVRVLGFKHVRGILLYGPPGTGKTLIARQIGKMLEAKSTKVVNGPELLSKYVGESEQNLRDIFQDARIEYEEKNEDSGLHLMIFDELDAICRSRGSEGAGARVGDGIVNQLLSILDGVNELNNIIIIGTTNRKDMIDEALLRPGRLEVPLEIGLPDKEGRLQILRIHTKKLEEYGHIADDVVLDDVAKITENYTGAELRGVVTSATSYATHRIGDAAIHGKHNSQPKDTGEPDKFILNSDDFRFAVNEVHPTHSGSNIDSESVMPWGVLHYSTWINELMSNCKNILKTVESENSLTSSSILLHGPPGAGKTTLAAALATRSGFSLVQMISPQHLVTQVGDFAKISYINAIFEKAKRSKLAIVILDDILGLIGWNSLGPVFSNNLLLTLNAHIRTTTSKESRLVVLATTSDHQTCQKLGLDQAFSDRFEIKQIQGIAELRRLLEEVQALGRTGHQWPCETLHERLAKDFRLGVKYVMSCIARASRSAQVELDRLKTISATKRALDKDGELCPEEIRDINKRRGEIFLDMVLDRIGSKEAM